MNETKQIRDYINQLPVGGTFTAAELKDKLNFTVPTRNISACILQIFRQNRSVLSRKQVPKKDAPHLKTFEYTKISDELVEEKRKAKDEEELTVDVNIEDKFESEQDIMLQKHPTLGINNEVDEIVIKIVQEHRDEIVSLNIKLCALQEKYNTIQREYNSLKEKNRELSGDYTRLVEENKELKDVNQGYQQKLLEKQKEITELRSAKKVAMNFHEFQDKYSKLPKVPPQGQK